MKYLRNPNVVLELQARARNQSTCRYGYEQRQSLLLLMTRLADNADRTLPFIIGTVAGLIVWGCL